MKKLLFALIPLVLVVSCAPNPPASNVPMEHNLKPTLEAEWKAKYEVYAATITSLNYEAWEKYIADDFEWIKADGTKVNRKDALAEFGALFDAKSITGTEHVLGVSQRGDVVDVALRVDFEIEMKVGSKMTYLEEGVDTWKEVDGQWKMVMSTDKPKEAKN